MDPDRLDSARIVSVRMLDGVGVDNELMKGHTARVRVLRGQQVAVAHPASWRAGHVWVRRRIDRLQLDATARASSLKVVNDHTAIIPGRVSWARPDHRRTNPDRKRILNGGVKVVRSGRRPSPDLASCPQTQVEEELMLDSPNPSGSRRLRRGYG